MESNHSNGLYVIDRYKDLFMNSIIPVKMLKREIDKIPNINITDFNGSNILYWSMVFCRSDIKIEIMKYIIDKGINTDNYDVQRETVLICACKRGELDIVKLLVESGSNVNHTDYCNDTALLWASYLNHIEIVKYLVENGAADVNHTYRDGRNSIMWASKQGNLEIMKYLINYTTDITRLDIDGYDIYDLANSKEIRLFLLDFFEKNKIYLCKFINENLLENTEKNYDINITKKMIDYYTKR